MRSTDPFLNPLLALTVNFFGGGGSAPKPPKEKKVNLPPVPAAPPAPAPLPPPPAPVPVAPPVRASGIEQQQAEQQAAQDAKKRQGIRKTLIAGDAQQASATPMGGQKTLLG